ncbi:terminase large subunit [Aeromonas veronii]
MTVLEQINRYCDDVLNDKIPACELIKKACKRHLWDLQRQEDPNYPYMFSEQRASHFIEFMRLLVDPDTNQHIVLMPWHYFFLGSIFGWVTKIAHGPIGQERHTRRFLMVQLFVARGNGKSFIASGIALYMLLFDGQRGAEIYSAATTRDQAKIVFNTCCRFAKSSGLTSLTRETKNLLRGPDDLDSHMRPLSADAQSMDGLRPHCAILDELHQHRTDDVYNSLKTALGKTSQSMLLSISTAGTNLYGIGAKVWALGETVLQSIETDHYKDDSDRFFVMIFTIDKKDDPYDQDVWLKANPTLGVIKKTSTMSAALNEVKITPVMLSDFMTKHLNVFVNKTDTWLAADKIEACYDPTIPWDRYRGSECWVGIDLSTKLDLTSMSFVIPDFDGVVHVLNKSYIPSEIFNNPRTSERIRQLYGKFAARGELVVTPGGTINYDYIIQDLLKYKELFDIRGIGVDPYNAEYFTKMLAQHGIEAIHVHQRASNLNEPAKHLQKLLYDGQLVFNSDLFKWCCYNARVRVDYNNNIKVCKETVTSENKIDALIAALIGFSIGVIPDTNQKTFAGFDDIDMIQF